MKTEKGSPFCVSWSSDANAGFSKDYITTIGAMKEAKRLAEMSHINRVCVMGCDLDIIKVVKTMVTIYLFTL